MPQAFPSYTLRTERAPNALISIRSARLTAQPDGQYELRITIENKSDLVIEEFTISTPPGDFGLGFPVNPRDTRTVSVILMPQLAASFPKLIAQQRLDEFTLQLLDVHWRRTSGSPTRVDVLSLVEPSIPVSLFFPNEVLGFPQFRPLSIEGDGGYPRAKILRYADLPVEILNSSAGQPQNYPLSGLTYQLEVEASQSWLALPKIEEYWGPGTRAGARATMNVRIPIEVSINGVIRTLRNYHFRVVKAYFGPPRILSPSAQPK